MESLVALAQELVRCPSVLGDEGAVIDCAAEAMQSRGFDEVLRDEVGNLLGVVRGAKPGPVLLMDAHVDTVDVEPRAEWTQGPFSGEVVEDRLYGRGSSDMKGALAAMIEAAGALDRSELTGTVVVAATLGEETVEGACLREACSFLETLGLAPDFVVIGEASELELVIAGRGRAEWLLEVAGVPCHASSPEQGKNAIFEMYKAMGGGQLPAVTRGS